MKVINLSKGVINLGHKIVLLEIRGTSPLKMKQSPLQTRPQRSLKTVKKAPKNKIFEACILNDLKRNQLTMLWKNPVKRSVRSAAASGT
jgi:hypothetical protein